MNAYPRGSEWRRWDLHVHTPFSYLTPSFSGITLDQYVEELEKAAVAEGIAVIGVTDYLSIEGYKQLSSRRNNAQNPALRSVSLLIPNIEFRLSVQARRGNSLNIHLLVDPTQENHIEEIERALGRLHFTYGPDREQFGCSRTELARFGKAMDPRKFGQDAVRFGIMQFKPSWEEFSNWLNDSPWLRNNSLTAVSGGEDGVGGLDRASGLTALKEQILRESHFVFSGNPSDREHFLGLKPGVSAEDISKCYGGLKGCIHGSDAHQTEQLFKPDRDRRCFVRADPTFVGLRQVVLEPESRVLISSQPPIKADQSRLIDRVRITNDQGWFGNLDLKLNDGVVAIIGEKGSGKTALAELIAFASGSVAPRGSQSSFVSKAKQLLRGTKVELFWCSGETTSGTLTDHPADCATPFVRYLSQDFVERLCSTDHTAVELQSEIESVVFSKLDASMKEGYSTFADLQRARQAASQRRRDEIKGKLTTNIRETVRLNKQIEELPEKRKNRDQKLEFIAELKMQIPAATVGVDEKQVVLLETSRTLLNEIQTRINNCGQTRRTLQDAISEYRRVKAATNAEIEETARKIATADPVLVTESPLLLKSLMPNWNDGVEQQIEKRISALENEINGLTGAEDRLSQNGESIFQVRALILSTEQQISTGEEAKKRLISLQTSIAAEEGLAADQGSEIDRLVLTGPKRIEELRLERLEQYGLFVAELISERDSLSQLYELMAARLEELSLQGSKMKFALTAAIEANRVEWSARFDSMTDSRKPATLARRDKVAEFINGEFDDSIMSGEQTRIVESLAKLEEIAEIASIKGELGNPTTSDEQFYEWLFATDHFAVSYQVNYDNTKLRYLSPGTRGIALLVLYLLMDDLDTRPLIIDQPEGNLDSSSVYGQLVPYIRSARSHRQIILVTHNPNLVVGTDADQVIVVTAERSEGQSHPTLTYRSGALEQTGISNQLDVRVAACSILEGGPEAFMERENRYSLVRR